MLDFEFLSNPISNLDRPIMYFCEDGFLRQAFLRSLQQVASASGQTLFSVNGSELRFAGGLFDGVPIYDFWVSRESTEQSSQKKAALTLASTIVEPAIVFVPMRLRDVGRAYQNKILRDFLIIEEPPINVRSLPRILEFLTRTSELPNVALAISDKNVQRQLRRFVLNNRDISFAEFVQEFEQIVVLSGQPTSPSTSEQALGDWKNASVVRAFNALILERDVSQLPLIFRGLEIRHPGLSSEELHQEIVRQTCLLFKVWEKKALDGVALINVSVWAGVLLASSKSEALAINDSDGITFVEGMTRRFLNHSSCNCWRSSLHGLWPDLRVPIKDNEKELLALFIALLKRYDNLPLEWMHRLSRAFESLLSPSLFDDSVRSETDWAQVRTSKLSELVGRETVAERLRSRCRQRSHSVPLILSGPAGVGKRAMARAYGRAAVCEEIERGADDSCGLCDNCDLFDQGLNLYVIDAKQGLASENFRDTVLNRIIFAPLSGRHFVVVDNAEVDNKLLDICLKTIERHLKSVVFVFLVQDLSRMNPAIRSRCETLHLLPLSDVLMRQLAEKIITEAHEDVLDLATKISKGLPGELLCASQFLSKNHTSLQEAQKALGLHWGSQAIGLWRSVLTEPNGQLSAQSGMRPDFTSVDLKVPQMRSVLSGAHLYRHTSEVMEPALLGATEDLHALVSCFSTRARELGVNFEEWWQRLALLWESCDIAEGSGMSAALRATFLMRAAPPDQS